VDVDFKERLLDEFPDRQFTFCVGDKYGLVEIHDFMRASRMLITGNSIFSVSAGLLANEKTIVFSPINFYVATDSRRNGNPFLGTGDFYLFR
jgi:hypothetical protein